MRIASLAISLAALTGCVNSNWSPVGDLVQDCGETNRLTYYYDADRDGWGEPYYDEGGTLTVARSVTACTASEAATEMAALIGEEDVAVAANNRDCIDDESIDERAAEITGRIGSICPDQLVPAATTGGDIYYTPLSAAGHELVIVHDDNFGDGFTPQQWGDLSADACGPYGWGGGILVDGLDGTEASGSLLSVVGQPGAILDALSDALPTSVNTYAGFVGVVGADFVPADQLVSGEYWYWESIDSSVNPPQPTYTPHADLEGTIPYCFGAEPSEEYSRLALVYDGTSWCLGLPTDAPPDGNVTIYRDPRLAHFVCQRPIPQGSDYAGNSDYGI